MHPSYLIHGLLQFFSHGLFLTPNDRCLRKKKTQKNKTKQKKFHISHQMTKMWGNALSLFSKVKFSDDVLVFYQRCPFLNFPMSQNAHSFIARSVMVLTLFNRNFVTAKLFLLLLNLSKQRNCPIIAGVISEIWYESLTQNSLFVILEQFSNQR